MLRTFVRASLVVAAGLTAANAMDPLHYALVHGVFKPAPDAVGEGAMHPLAPEQKVDTFENRNQFRITSQEGGEAMAFPVLAGPGAKEPASLADFTEGGETFLAALDLTGCGVSDLIYSRKDMGGWKVLSNGARLPKPTQGFCVGFYPTGADTPRTELIPADNRDLTVDQDLLAATGDFLGNGTEQLAYTRPGQSQVWIVGAHGVTTMKANLKGIEASGGLKGEASAGPAAPGVKNHWLFPFKATRKGQRTRLAYYRAGSDHLLRLVPKGMEFIQERVPLKGNWERLNQAVLDWPQPMARAAAPEAEGKEPAAK